MSDGDDPQTEGGGRVAEEYDFEDFGPRDMERMSAEEWEDAFDADSWVTGPELLDRVEADLRVRIAERDVFAVVERESDADGERLLAYSDEGYAVVHEDGSVEGRGTVLRDVKPSVALASMPDYEVPDVPADASLPDPDEVASGSGSLGNLVLQTIGLMQVGLGALLLLTSFLYDPLVRAFGTRIEWTFADPRAAPAYEVAGVVLHPLGSSAIVAALAGLGFVVLGVFLLVVVANARLSDRFRSEEFRERLRATQRAGDERPEFVPEPGEDDTNR